VFAPDNDAFARALVALNTTATAFLVPGNSDLLTSILQYHIVGFKALSTDLKMGDTAVSTFSECCFHASEACAPTCVARTHAWLHTLHGQWMDACIHGAFPRSRARAVPWHGMPLLHVLALPYDDVCLALYNATPLSP
jgi:hypothetical protein